MRNGFPDSRGFWGITSGNFENIDGLGRFYGFVGIFGAKIGLNVALLIDREGGIRGSVGVEEPGGGDLGP